MGRHPVDHSLAREREAAPRWGQVLITPPVKRPYVTRISGVLIIHRPGTRLRERRLLRIRDFLFSESGVVYLTLFAAMGLVGGWLGAGLVVAAWVVVWAWASAACLRRGLETRVVRVTASRRGRSGDVELMDRLLGQVELIDSSDLTPVDFEQEWARIYDQAGKSESTKRREGRGQR